MPRSHKAFSLGPLGGQKLHKMVKFRPRGMVDKRETEQAQLFETADERGCTPMFGTAHRRASAVPYPRRYEGPSLCFLGARKVHKSVKFASGPWHGRPARRKWGSNLGHGRDVSCHVSPVKCLGGMR